MAEVAADEVAGVAATDWDACDVAPPSLLVVEVLDVIAAGVVDLGVAGVVEDVVKEVLVPPEEPELPLDDTIVTVNMYVNIGNVRGCATITERHSEADLLIR